MASVIDSTSLFLVVGPRRLLSQSFFIGFTHAAPLSNCDYSISAFKFLANVTVYFKFNRTPKRAIFRSRDDAGTMNFHLVQKNEESMTPEILYDWRLSLGNEDFGCKDVSELEPNSVSSGKILWTATIDCTPDPTFQKVRCNCTVASYHKKYAPPREPTVEVVLVPPARSVLERRGVHHRGGGPAQCASQGKSPDSSHAQGARMSPSRGRSQGAKLRAGAASELSCLDYSPDLAEHPLALDDLVSVACRFRICNPQAGVVAKYPDRRCGAPSAVLVSSANFRPTVSGFGVYIAWSE
ncbi:hypothetical protein B0H11DRAFT_1903417 [Mycena galericulata]|nr:hypothetical protein B0H11DRAFT_1903417 [Mycena galericulata]